MRDFTPAQIEAILARRAERLAGEGLRQDQDEQSLTVAVVSVGNERLGIPLDKLEIISKPPPLAQLPQMPPAVKGLVQIRGELIAVVSLDRWFGGSGVEGNQMLAVVAEDGKKLGLLVDSVAGFREIADVDLAASFHRESEEDGRPVMSTTRDFVSLLDIERLFNSPELRTSRESSTRHA